MVLGTECFFLYMKKKPTQRTQAQGARIQMSLVPRSRKPGRGNKRARSKAQEGDSSSLFRGQGTADTGEVELSGQKARE